MSLTRDRKLKCYRSHSIGDVTSISVSSLNMMLMLVSYGDGTLALFQVKQGERSKMRDGEKSNKVRENENFEKRKFREISEFRESLLRDSKIGTGKAGGYNLNINLSIFFLERHFSTMLPMNLNCGQN